MVKLLTTDRSKADTFLLPLTGLSKEEKYNPKSYLFWNDYSILDYNLILTFEYDNYDDFLNYCSRRIFPILDRKGYLVESYDLENRSIFVLDMSEWAMDIQQFLVGKYSKLGKECKSHIEKFHTFGNNHIPVDVYAVLYPTTKMTLLREDGKDMTPIEYVAKNYGIDLDRLKKIGEIGSIYTEFDERLLTDVEYFCKDVS